MDEEPLGFDPTISSKGDRRIVMIQRHYHHGAVHVRSQLDEIHGNIRRGLIPRDAKVYQLEPLSQSADGEGDSDGTADAKRSLHSQSGSSLRKRARRTMPVSRTANRHWQIRYTCVSLLEIVERLYTR